MIPCGLGEVGEQLGLRCAFCSISVKEGKRVRMRKIGVIFSTHDIALIIMNTEVTFCSPLNLLLHREIKLLKYRKWMKSETAFRVFDWILGPAPRIFLLLCRLYLQIHIYLRRAPQRTYENDTTTLQCSPLLYNLFSDIFVLRAVSRFKGHFIQSFSVLYSFLIVK